MRVEDEAKILMADPRPFGLASSLKEIVIMSKSKSMKGSDGERKLAADHGRIQKKNRRGTSEGPISSSRLWPAHRLFEEVKLIGFFI